ncbi:MAG: HEAT repeat domain-containing protein [Alphaproteobacteria bacterium]|nr:MAG: HEAT repeat domain-containing protein [Alphaproteobacteria bacterium]
MPQVSKKIKSAEEFVKLRCSDDLKEQEIASWGEADVSVWLRVIECYPEMKKWVAHNKKIPLEILRVLARDADYVVRTRVAEKRKLDQNLFELLAHDPDYGVRRRIALNRKVPRAILEQLAGDEHEMVREAALERLTQIQ